MLPAWPFFVALVANLLIGYALRKQVNQVYGAIDIPPDDLRILGLMVARFEKETFASPLLNKMQAEMKVKGEPAAKRIHRLERWVEMLGNSSHYLMRAVRRLLLWREQVAMGVEVWRQESGARIGYWLEAIAEFEAISAIATLAFEHPHWHFPDLADSPAAQFEASGLQHPLIARDKCIPNDVALNQDCRLLIVSGSNMSGKSTLLRAIGLNTVLAWAGAPVAAVHLRLSCLHTGASIRVTDSLKDNRSRFFAEITRLRQIVDLTRAGRPTLFLLDELLSGTNSRDRRTGASGIVRGLLRGNSIGLLTTHDLALTEIENDLPAKNVHFEDRISDGRVEFDYKLQAGVVTHSNAIELMRAVGLDVS
jgi:DNA mismatch repair ATPase MutS